MTPEMGDRSPAAESEARILDHEYDGIQEYDNPMPRWWVSMFWATIVFSILYAINIGPVGSGAGWIAEYESDMAAFRELYPEGAPTADAGQLAALAADPSALASGQTVYSQMCAACHGAAGEGTIGPNLTDDYWIHGASLPEILHTVSVGVLAKGMPAWDKMLKPEEVNAVVVYVASLRGTDPPNPKAAEGELVNP
jgi:cytochrome c oxidase cbb3-type subunit 3